MFEHGKLTLIHLYHLFCSIFREYVVYVVFIWW